MHYSKRIDTSVEKSLLDQCRKIDKEKERMSNVSYASAIRNLMYTMLCTWPNICFVVALVNHYQRNPRPTHW